MLWQSSQCTFYFYTTVSVDGWGWGAQCSNIDTFSSTKVGRSNWCGCAVAHQKLHVHITLSITFFADSFIVCLFFMFFEILLRDDYMRLTDLNLVNSIVPLIPFFICILKFASHKEIFWKDIKIDVFYFSYPFLVLYFRGNPGGCNLGDERECNLNPLHFLLCFIF